MNSIELNTVFYSKGNVELAYELKKACRNINANVYNIRQFAELVFTLNETHTSVLFLDYDCMEIPQAVMEYVIHYDFHNPVSIVLITDKDIDVNFDSKSKFYKISPNNIQDGINFLEDKLKLTAAQWKSSFRNIREFGEEITDYLILNGFSTLHKGFAYIKECIVFAVTQKGSMGSLNSEIYPYVASKFNTIVENVERNIRNAVLQAKKNDFNNNDLCKLADSTKLSNKVVIGYIVERSLNKLLRA